MKDLLAIIGTVAVMPLMLLAYMINFAVITITEQLEKLKK